MEFQDEHYEPKTVHLGFIDREIFAKKSPKTWKKSKISISTHLNGFLG